MKKNITTAAIPSNFKVTHLVAGDLFAGAARGALWLHDALLDLGVDSTILTDAADWEGKANVVSITHNKWDLKKRKLRHVFDRLPVWLYRKRKRTIFSTGRAGARLAKHPAIQNADVVNLHWINKGFLSIKEIGRIQKPIVWTVRDLWPITGGCHMPMECDGFLKGCGNCPILASNQAEDLSTKIFRSKQKHYPAGIQFVGLSSWVSKNLKNSQLAKNYDVSTIPNCIDIQFFNTENKAEARSRLNLPPDQKLVLFGAMQPEQPHKGLDKLVEAVNASKEEFTIVAFGNTTDKTLKRFSRKAIGFGRVENQEKLRDLYQAATCFVAPSLVESFGKTLAESFGCGTPVVAFNSSGPADIVTHLETGYLAEAFEPESLRKGIEWVISDQRDPEKLSIASRKRAETEYSFEAVGRQYAALYQKFLASRKI